MASLPGFSKAPVAAMVLTSVPLQESCWQHVVLPPDQVHDGDDQSNADVSKVVLVGNAQFQSVLRQL